MKRRPTALDRNIVDWIEKRPPGYYVLEIPRDPEAGTYSGLARLKRKGQMNIMRGDGSITFCVYPLSDDTVITNLRSALRRLASRKTFVCSGIAAEEVQARMRFAAESLKCDEEVSGKTTTR